MDRSRHDWMAAYPGCLSSVTKAAAFRVSGLVLARVTDMSTQAIAVERKLTKYFRGQDLALGDPYNIAMRITIDSDAARIFETLTRPEYLETWMTLPGDDADCYVIAWKQTGGFRLDHYRRGRRDVTIGGEYRICRRRKMLFTWRMDGDIAGPETLVYIGLHGNFTNTILELHHRGISSAADYLWRQEMWNRSLDRLSRLFQR
jgi:uncharacterized protein YndB with AHSA1/START domain